MGIPVDKHLSLGGVPGEENGCSVVLHYGSPVDEAVMSMSGAAICDISHLGRIQVKGHGSLRLLERACTSDVTRQEDDTAAATLLCSDDGGIIDICYLFRFDDFWMLTCSPGNAPNVIEQLRSVNAGECLIKDVSPETCHFAVTGARAEEALQKHIPFNISGLPRHAVKSGMIMLYRYMAARVGLTSAWSVEIILPAALGEKAWDRAVDRERISGLAPSGTAAREIVRLEHGFPRRGTELDKTVDPVVSGLEWLLRKDGGYIGQDAIKKLQENPPPRKRVLLEFSTDCPVAPGTGITWEDSSDIGTVTSAVLGTSSGKLVAQGYISPVYALPGGNIMLKQPDMSVKGKITGVFSGRPGLIT